MQKVILNLDTLTCPSCMTKIETALTKQSGVQTVKVLFNASKVKAVIQAPVSKEHLVQVVQGLGYTVKAAKVKEL